MLDSLPTDILYGFPVEVCHSIQSDNINPCTSFVLCYFLQETTSGASFKLQTFSSYKVHIRQRSNPFPKAFS